MPQPSAFAPQPGTPPPAEPGSSKKKPALIIGLVVVALLAAGGIYLATRSDDDSPTATTETVVDETAATQSTPETVDTTPATPLPTVPNTNTTDLATTTTAAAIPAGAIDLGHGVYLPVPDGWKTTNKPADVTTISDGKTSFAVQVLARPAGEDPAKLMQEYIDTFDTTFPTVTYGPSRYIGRIEGDMQIDEYGIYYATYDPSDGIGLLGGVYAYVRGDGLTAIYDVFGGEDVGNLPDDAYNDFEHSLSAAPPLGNAVELTEREPFRVTTSHPNIAVDGLLAFTPAPGFNPITAGNGQGMASNGTYDFDVRKLTGQASLDAAVASAQAILAASYSGLTFGQPTNYDADSYGVTQRSVGWTGTYADGHPSSGAFDVFYDSASSNAVVAFRNWFDVTPGDTTEPNAAESKFMYRSIVDSFTNIP